MCERATACCFFSSRRRHTRYWRDWSSDVCSSEVLVARGMQAGEPRGLLDEVAQDLPDPTRSEEEQMTTPGNFRRENEWRETEPTADEDEGRTHLIEPVPAEIGRAHV